MTARKSTSTAIAGPVSIAALCVIGLLATACRPGEEPGAHVAGWTLIDPAQRHPILVAQQPTDLSLRVARGSNGLTPHQRSQIADFLSGFHAAEAGDSRIALHVPSGAPNEVAVLNAVADLRELLRGLGHDESRLTVHAFRARSERDASIRLTYSRYVAEAPICGQWPVNVGDDPRNLPYHNLGCSTQRNLAAQIANPADLLGPRTRGPASAERRDEAWEKWTKGQSTISKKESDERAAKTN
jgi:pilus assembly protein CpaD